MKAYSALVGGTIFMMFPGSAYITGNITPYLASYYDVPSSLTTLMLPSFFVGGTLLFPLGSFLSVRFDPRIIVACGGGFACLMLLIASYMESFGGFWVFFILGYSVLQGSTYLVPIHHSWIWFPKNIGLASGILIGGFGLSALIFDNVSTAIVNPDNKGKDDFTNRYPDSVNEKVPVMIRTLMVCYLCITIIGVITIFPGQK